MGKRVRFDVPYGEDNLRKTIEASKAAFVAGEWESSLSDMEFLYRQSKYIKKQWWLLQGGLLLAVCLMLHFSQSDYFVRRSLGVAAPVFAVLILPELWKNRSCGAMEVEGTTFYTIRQVYAARLTLFGGADLVLLTLFLFGASAVSRVTVWELLIQFFLPFNVTCCICFQSLYSSRIGSETFSILLCAIWTGLWVLVVLKDAVYDAISVPVWIGLLAASFAFLGFGVYRGQKKIYKIWEADPLWN